MSNVLIALGSYYGIVTISDSKKDPARSTATYQINEQCIAFVYREADGAKDFIDKYILPIKNSSFEELIKKSTDELKQHSKDYLKQKFSFVLATYINGTPMYHGFWLDKDTTPHNDRVTKFVHFINNIEDLANYLIVKVYSEQISLEELKNLAVFIALQCVKVLGYSPNFDITTISDKGIKLLSEGEVKDVLYKQEQVDHKLKKIFSDFFVSVRTES